MRVILAISACCVILVGASYIYALNQSNIESNEFLKTEQIAKIEIINAKKNNVKAARDEDICQANNRNFQPAQSIAPKIEEISAQVERAIINPTNLIQKSNSGDAEAKLVLFNLVNSCFRRGQKFDFTQPMIKGNEGCPLLPSQFVEKPLTILEEAAQDGSPYAKLIYAQYAQSRIARLRESATNEDYQEAAKINRTAEQYGEEAAQAGLLEAWQFMTRAYYTGSFGVRNPTLAYAHALPTLTNGSTQDEIRFVALLKSQLMPSQIIEAQKIAFRCKSNK